METFRIVIGNDGIKLQAAGWEGSEKLEKTSSKGDTKEVMF